MPLGYADGVRRGLSSNADVLIGGRRRPIIGTVTMDQLMVDCGDDPVRIGDEVVLIGRQGDERITAEEWAGRLGTIGYEIVCGIGARVPRLLVGGSSTPVTSSRHAADPPPHAARARRSRPPTPSPPRWPRSAGRAT